MGPSKRKGSVRRQVLDLATKEDKSPLRPTWQTKYQHALPKDIPQQNGDSQTALPSNSNNNPLSELLNNYNSDSDAEESTKPSNSNLDAKVEDFLKEIQSIAVEPSSQVSSESSTTQTYHNQTYNNLTYPSSVTCWQQCYDQNSGYPYYWNTETNEVTWEMPPDLKAAIASVALKQQSQQSVPKQTITQSVTEGKKKSVKYPWQTESDSEDEKIEMITSFGPQSGEGSEEDEEEEPKNKKVEKTASTIASAVKYYSHSSKMSISLAPEDPEGMNENLYETSSLLAHGVQDNGPPGDDNFLETKGIQSDTILTNKTKTFFNSQKSEENESKASNISKFRNDNLLVENKLQINNEKNNEVGDKQTASKCSPDKVADDVIAQIENETPPDYTNSLEVEKEIESKEPNNEENTENKNLKQNQTTSKVSAIALVANYSDDSESEDTNSNEKSKSNVKLKISPTKPLFPIEIPQEKEEKIKPVFPCVEEDVSRVIVDNCLKEALQDDLKPPSNIYNSEIDITDPGAFKAFKRKKRIEFATTTYGPSTSKLSDVKICNLESGGYTAQYNMDPNSNEHRGFGFTSNRYQTDGERKTYKNCGGIQFVKAETINFRNSSESMEKPDIEFDGKSSAEENSMEFGQSEEIQNSATLLKEKVAFLTMGNNEISPIQHMAIELETLVLAWQQGALTPSYLLRWLKEKCAELIHHEKKAAPSGWTCLWDRQSKRYYYRNTTTKAIQWEYPNVDEKIKTKEDAESGGDEMDICDTPPHLSPTEPVKQTDEQPLTPPPPVISDTTEYVAPASPTPQPPSPPKISFCSENEPLATKSTKKKKRKIDDISCNNKDEKTISVPTPPTSFESSEEAEVAPPLPPMPPPPPPPPEESPPPLPETPPPLPLDTDQPLPPGVDEPEYSLYRRVSPKHFKKTQADSSAYSAELMMTYGYGLPVVPSNTQTMTLPIQTLEYHTYMHDPVTNPYLVQSASTSHVIQCSAKKPKVSLNSELMSFYSDLAMLEAPLSENNSNSQSKSAQPSAPEPELSPAVVTTATTVTVTTSTASSSSNFNNSETVASNGVNIKKKKKQTKTTTGLSLKKKGVSSLVAKWQQVQQEVKKDFSDDEDVSSTK